MLQKIFSIFKARNKEFLRDRASMAWSFLFPFLLVFGFAYAFSGEKPIFKIGVLSASDTIDTKASHLLALEHITFVPILNQEEGIKKVERHQLDLLVDLSQGRKYWSNTSSANGYMIEHMLDGLGEGPWQKQSVTGEVRYVDWFFPGVVGLNMMFSALFGVGYVIVRYRKNGMLKRLKATPVSAFEFLSAQVLSRLALLIFNSVVVLVGCNFFLHFQMNGSWLDLFVVYILGAVCLISIGLLVASRVSSEEFAGGILNMLTWPMMFLSGVWFSLDGMNPFLQKVAQFFPLTHVVAAARAVMIDGQGLHEIFPHLLILGVTAVVALGLGSFLFRWD